MEYGLAIGMWSKGPFFGESYIQDAMDTIVGNDSYIAMSKGSAQALYL